MGSKPWTHDCIRRLLDSRKYRATERFTIKRGRKSARGIIECGHERSVALIFVGDTVFPLDRKTLIDGVPAPDWRDPER